MRCDECATVGTPECCECMRELERERDKADKAWQAAEAYRVQMCALLGVDYTCEEPETSTEVVARMKRKVADLTAEIGELNGMTAFRRTSKADQQSMEYWKEMAALERGELGIAEAEATDLTAKLAAALGALEKIAHDDQKVSDLFAEVRGRVAEEIATSNAISWAQSIALTALVDPPSAVTRIQAIVKAAVAETEAEDVLRRTERGSQYERDADYKVGYMREARRKAVRGEGE